MEDVIRSWQGRGVDVTDIDSPKRTVSEGGVSPFIHFWTVIASAGLSCTSEAFGLRVHGRGSSIGLVSKGCRGIILILVLEIGLVTCTVTSS
jgi:hypothetical protein